MLNTGYDSVRICPDCYVIQGFYKTPTAVKQELFVSVLHALATSKNSICPSCQSPKFLILKSHFLISGKTLLWATVAKRNTNDMYTDPALGFKLQHIAMLRTGAGEKQIEDLEKRLGRAHGRLPFTELVKRIGIERQMIAMKDEEDPLYVWTPYGRFEKSEVGDFVGHAQALFNKGRYEETVAFCANELASGDKTDEQRWKLLFLQAAGHAALGQFGSAISRLEQTLRYKLSNEQQQNVWLLMGEAHETLSQNKDALRSYDKVLALDPNNAHAKAHRARLRAV